MVPAPDIRDPSVSLSEADDRTLVGRSVDGDTRAFEVLVRRYGPLLRAYSRRILGFGGDVDDAVQETFIAAWRQLDSLDDSVAVKSWLITIVSRKSIDQIRARQDSVPLSDDEEVVSLSPDPESTAERRQRDAAVTSALSTLPEDQQRCWVLREIVGLSYGEIAEELDIPVSTIRGTLSRARKNLMSEMEGWR